MKNDNLSEMFDDTTDYKGIKVKQYINSAVKKFENKKQEVSERIMESEITGEQGLIIICEHFDEIFGEALTGEEDLI